MILAKKEEDLNLIDNSLVENTKKLINMCEDEKNNNTIKKLNSEINEFKRIQLSKDNEISKINEVLITKKNEIISLRKIIEAQKNGSREKEIEEKFNQEKAKYTKKINDMEIRIYNIIEEKNNLIKTQNKIQERNDELMKKLNIKEEELENEKNKKYFDNNNLKIIQNNNFTIPTEIIIKEKIEINNNINENEFIQSKEEKEQLIFNNNELTKEINEMKKKFENINNNEKIINKKNKELEKTLEDYKSGKIISEKIKKFLEKLNKNSTIEKEQLAKKYKNEIEILNLKNNSLSVINQENEKKMKDLTDKNKLILGEKNELENVIFVQEKKVNELEVKINKIDMILTKKNEKIKENEKCTLQLINIVNDQQMEIKKLKKKKENENKSLNEIISLKTQIQHLNNTFKQNTIKNSRTKNLTLDKNIKKAFSTKKERNLEKFLNNNYIKNDKKGAQKRKRFLKIKINDPEGQYYSTSNLVKSPRQKYPSYIPSKIGDDLVYLNVNMNWINTKGTKSKANNEVENKVNKFKNKINLATPKLPNITYSNKNNIKINKLNKLQDEEDVKKEEINQMMQKIIDEI